ncbi:hypothetical protein [Brevibacillus massiliensis]|uniref:hypothetical protein n=1 Tax=Brevibacillus massiliensis TaxID=1118054 RepID=UPI0002E7FDAB|nr:hypothetical protein [Brevibacillus massiliensis]
MIRRTGFQQEIFLSEEDKRQGFWVQDDVHLGHAASPLFASFQIPAMTEGTKRASENLKSPVSQFHVKLSDGRIYQHTIPYSGKLEQRLQEHRARVEPLFPVLKKRLFDCVEEVLLPFYRRLDFYRSQPLTLAGAGQIVTELHEFYIRAWQFHFELVMPRSSLTMALERAYTEATGDPDPTAVYGYLSGVMNKTLETDRELWNLARQVKNLSWLAALFANVAAEEVEQRLSGHQDGRELLFKWRPFSGNTDTGQPIPMNLRMRHGSKIRCMYCLSFPGTPRKTTIFPVSLPGSSASGKGSWPGCCLPCLMGKPKPAFCDCMGGRWIAPVWMKITTFTLTRCFRPNRACSCCVSANCWSNPGL